MPKIQVDTKWVHILLVTKWSISHEMKKHMVIKDVVGLLLGEAVSTKKHIVAKDVVGLLLGEVVSTKKTHCCKGCGWLTSRR
jgi:hypothetical protein